MSNIDARTMLKNPECTRIVCLTNQEQVQRAPEFSKRADIAEYRHDLIDTTDVDQLRYNLRTIGLHMPVLFTNRWGIENGLPVEDNAPPIPEIHRIELLPKIIDLVQVVDVEINAPAFDTLAFIAKRKRPDMLVIASFHDFSGETTEDDWLEKIEVANRTIEPDWLKIAVKLDSPGTIDDFYHFMNHAPPNVIPLGMGTLGKVARTIALKKQHPAIPAMYFSAEKDSENTLVKGQLTLDDADKLWHELGYRSYPNASPSNE